MWASDFTEIATGHRWSDELFAFPDSVSISLEDKEWILAATARKVF